MRHLKIRILALAIAASGCWTSSGDGEQMRRDIDALQSSLRAQRESNATEQERLKAESTQKAKELREAMDALNRAARKSGADLAVDLEKAQNDVAQLRGQLEVLQHRQDEIEAKQGERDRKLAETSAALEKSKKQMDAAEHPTEKGAIYALAVKKLDAGETGRARELFSDFLARFRTDPLAANAQFWLGETYYVERRFKDAIVEFQRVLKDWKASEKVPDALLKIGLSFQSTGDCGKARLFFDEITASHRGTEAARIAKLKAAECKKKRGQ